MKKSLLACVCAVLTLSVFITSCGSEAKGNLNLPAINIDVVKESTDLYELSVDPRLELISIIAKKAGYEDFNNPDWNGEVIVSMMDTWFEKYKNEPAVKTAKSFKKKIRYAECLVMLTDYIKPDFSGEALDLNEMPENLKYYWGKVKPAEIEKFIVQINDLAQKCKFEKLYLTQKSYYIGLLASYKDTIVNGGTEDLIKIEDWLRDFYRGYGPEKNIIYVSDLLGGHTYYSENQSVDGNKKILYSSAYRGEFTIVLYTNLMNAETFVNSVWDEIGPVCEEFMTKFKVANNVTSDLITKNQVISLIADSWSTDYILKNWNEDERNSFINESKKYYMLDQYDELVKITDEYVQNPDKYKNVNDLLPAYKKLIESF